jgi:hypothetical protein
MSQDRAARPWWQEEERAYATASDEQIKALAIRYKLLPGQVRGLIARFGWNTARLDAEADRLRHR